MLKTNIKNCNIFMLKYGSNAMICKSVEIKCIIIKLRKESFTWSLTSFWTLKKTLNNLKNIKKFTSKV